MACSEELVTLRPVLPEDLFKIQSWDSDPGVIKYIGRKYVGQGHSLDWLRQIRKKTGKIAMAITDFSTGHLIGLVELDEISWRARTGELRICIGDCSYWGKGYGTEALHKFMDFVFATTTLQYVYLRVYRSNQRAVRCYLKCGFKTEALLRAGTRSGNGHEDLMLMGIRREACANAPVAH